MRVKRLTTPLFFVFAVLAISILSASCKMNPANFDISLGDLVYASGDDYVYAEVTTDSEFAIIKSAKCYWTFDGTEPSSSQTTNTNCEGFGDPDEQFKIVIPSDFYSGTIKFLCEITYSENGKTNTETKTFEKEFTTKYHSVTSNTEDLYKNKGFQEEYSITTVSSNIPQTVTYTAKNDGKVTISILLGETDSYDIFYYREGSQIGGGTIMNVKAGDTIKVTWKNSTYISSGASSIKSAEYLIILE